MSFSLTRKTDYALVALAALAREKLAGDEPLSAREISQRHNLPLPLLMNALKALHRAEIIASRRGAGGGYYLAHDPERVTIKEVIEAMEGPVSVTLCSDDPVEEDGDCGTCHIHAACPISDPMQQLNQLLNEFLSRITLKSLTSGLTMPHLSFLGVPV